MPAPKSTAISLLTGILGTLGFSVAAGVLVTVMVAPAIAVTGITANNTVGIFNDLPEYMELDSGSQQNTIVALEPDGVTELHLATIYKQNREEVSLDEISDYLECAAIAGEDRRFYEHGGVDLPSVIRAAVGQVTGENAGGASTLTMQTVRNIWQQQALNDDSLTPEQRQERIADALAQTADRKLREMKLAIGLEKNYSKEEILQGYLNIAGFGGNTYGVQAAAQQYFGLDAGSEELTPAQAASLLAIVQYPNARNLGDPENYAANQARRDVILQSMYDFGIDGEPCISKAELDEALATPVDEEFVNPQAATVGCRNATPRYGFVCDYVLNIIDELPGLGSDPEERMANWARGGYKVVVTIQTDMQTAAWDNVHRLAPANETRFQLGSAAASVEIGTGNIVQMVQNKDFDDALEPTNPLTSTAVNFATDLEHGGSVGFQPGSTYKPYVMLGFLAAGHGIEEAFNASILEFNQGEFADSCPATADGPPWGGIFKTKNDSNETGSWTVRRATAASVNSVFVQMAKAIDQCEIRKLAESIGLHNASGDPLSTRPSCSIGGCENNLDPITQAAAYAAIANQGVYCKPRMVADIIDVDSGESLGGEPVECGQSLVSPSVANTTAYAMEGVMTGTGSRSNPRDGTPYIGKTGTTDSSWHTWMVGSSTRVATAVWVGNIEGKQALRSIRVGGFTAALLRHEIFRPIAQAIDTRYPGGAFPGPDPALLVGSPVEVPNVVGLSPESAKQAIEEVAQLIYADGGEVDSDLPAGQVASTNPGAGAQVPRGTTVTVYRSNGLAEPVPSGAVGMPHGAAEASYESQGWDTETVCVDDEDLGIPPATPPGAPGVVYEQDPAPGTMRNPASTTITLRYYEPSC